MARGSYDATAAARAPKKGAEVICSLGRCWDSLKEKTWSSGSWMHKYVFWPWWKTTLDCSRFDVEKRGGWVWQVSTREDSWYNYLQTPSFLEFSSNSPVKKRRWQEGKEQAQEEAPDAQTLGNIPRAVTETMCLSQSKSLAKYLKNSWARTATPLVFSEPHPRSCSCVWCCTVMPSQSPSTRAGAVCAGALGARRASPLSWIVFSLKRGSISTVCTQSRRISSSVTNTDLIANLTIENLYWYKFSLSFHFWAQHPGLNIQM